MTGSMVESRAGSMVEEEDGKVAVQRCKSAGGLWKSAKVNTKTGRGVAG